MEIWKNQFRNCNYCGKQIELTKEKYYKEKKDPDTKFYCNNSCAAKWKGEHLYKVTRPQVNCVVCSNTFILSVTQYQDYKKGKRDFCCNRKCQGIYVNSKIDKSSRNDKVSTTLRNRRKEDINNSNYKRSMTKLERYGDASYNNSVQQKETMLARYGGVGLASESILTKMKNIKQSRYGDSNYTNIKKAMITKRENGVYTNQNHLPESTKDILNNKDIMYTYISSLPVRERYVKFISNDLRCSETTVINRLHQYNLWEMITKNVSYLQQEVIDFIKSNTEEKLIINDREVIRPNELDIYIPSLKVAFEINDTFFRKADIVGTTYYYKKSKLCEEKGIRLIHIWEYEWNSERQRPILKSLILDTLGKTKNIIYAHNCKIEYIENTNSLKDFFNINHIQGFRGGKFAINLKHNNEIIMSFIFGNNFFGKGKYEYEVIRSATKLEYTVTGGMSKIWSYFIKKFKPSNCVYYVDYNYFNGHSLKNLNMQYVTTNISYKNYWIEHWKTHEKGVIKNREPMYNKETKEAMSKGMGFPIYNAGVKVYIWSNSSIDTNSNINTNLDISIDDTPGVANINEKIDKRKLKKVIIPDRVQEEFENLYYNTDLSNTEIAENLGLKISRIKTMISKLDTKRTDEHIKRVKQKANKKVFSKTGYNFEKKEIQDKIKQTKLSQYGNKNPFVTNKFKNQSRQSKLNLYGDINYNNREKSIKTCIERYGVDNTMKVPEVIQKGTTSRMRHIDEIALKISKAKTQKFKDPKAKQSMLDKVASTCLQRYGVSSYILTNDCKVQKQRISKLNKLFADKINAAEFEYTLDNYSYDLKKNNTLIEIDPTISHNTEISYVHLTGLCMEDSCTKHNPINKNYHRDKTQLAEQYGFKCIHVFDWDDWDKVSYLVKDKSVLYARNLLLKEIDEVCCNDFLDRYHLQNSCKGQSIRVGLFNNNELVEVMTFGKPRYNKNYEWELLRLCTHKDYMVVGGAERLLKYFKNKYNPESIISYCDKSKFNGDVYSRLGFTVLAYNYPSKHWSKGKTQITDNLLRQRGFDQLFNTDYGKGTDNENLMIAAGWLPVYDCGQVTYLWSNSI